MTNSHIEAVIFDMGRVLVAIDNRLLTERLFKGMETADSQELARRTMADPAMVAFNSGHIGQDEFYERMRIRFKLDLDFESFAKLWCEIFYPMDGMEDLVQSLDNKVNLGLLSDTDPLHWNFIVRSYPWIGQLFKKPTLSYKLGVMKPNPAIYLQAARNVGTAPQDCLYIDDLEDNVLGARAAGMQTMRFVSVEQLREGLTDLHVL